MCIIYACFSGRPSDKLLDRGWEGNEDGAGLMWYDKETKKIKWEKGYSKLAEVKKEHKKLPFPYGIHFRNSSMADGGALELTHPFPLTEDVSSDFNGSAPAALMHNGHWNDWAKTVYDFAFRHKIKIPMGMWSDTRAYAFLAAHLGEQVLPMMDKFDRFLILNADRGDGEPDFSYYGMWKNPEKSLHEKGFFISTDVDKKINYGTTVYAPGYGGYPKVSEAADGKSPLVSSASPQATGLMTTSGSSQQTKDLVKTAGGSTNITSSAPLGTSESDTLDFRIEELKQLMDEISMEGEKVGHA